MAEEDQSDGNEPRGVSDLKAAFENFIVQAAPKTHRPICRTNSVTSRTLKEFIEKRSDGQEIKGATTTEGAEKLAPKVLPKPQRKVASNIAAIDHEKHQPDGAEKPAPEVLPKPQRMVTSNMAATEKHQPDATDQIELDVNEKPIEKLEQKNDKELLKTDGDQMASELKNEIEEEIIQKNKGQEICQQYNVKNDKDDNNNDQPLGQVNTDSSVTYENKKLQQENTKLSENIKYFNENELLIKENMNMVSQIQELQLMATNLSTKNLRLHRENIDYTNGIQHFREENKNLKIENQRLQQENINCINELKQLRQEITAKKSEYQQLQHEHIDCAYKIQQLREENTKEIRDFRIQKRGMAREIQQLEKEIKTKNEIQQLLEEKTLVTNEIQQLQQEKSDVTSEVQSLQTERINITNETQQLQQEKANVTNEIQPLRQQKHIIANEVQELRQQKRNVTNEIEQLQQEKTNITDEIQELRQQNTISDLITESGSVVVSSEELGRGAYGAVFKGEFYGTEVAVKEYHQIILSPFNERVLHREILIATQCRHPNLLQFICATENDQHHLLIVTEKMDMTLRTLMEQRARESSRLEYQEIKSISLDVARGLSYLHSQKPNPIIHRDISSANVLLWIENNSVRRAKISDYGAANFMEACNTRNPGAILYSAPEASGRKHDAKIDVFSYGILVCEMSICELPNPDERENQINRIPNAGIKHLVEICTTNYPQSRPIMQDVIVFLQRLP